jgi:tRNA threonylcarbamoyladenosine biosynthesis protein TsaB
MGEPLARADSRAPGLVEGSRVVLILGITTATNQVGCAIGGHEGVLASIHSARGKRHAETLTPSIEFLTRQARVELTEIGCVAVDIGPGLFTGLRVGVASAKAIAHALRVPMVGVSSLDLLAFPVRWSSRLLVATVDARRGELFYASYRQVPGGVQRLGDPSVTTPDDLASELLACTDEVLLVGDGALRYRETFEGLSRVELADQGLAHPSAASLVQLAHARALREDFVQPWELQPLYLRKPDAEINWITRDGL